MGEKMRELWKYESEKAWIFKPEICWNHEKNDTSLICPLSCLVLQSQTPMPILISTLPPFSLSSTEPFKWPKSRGCDTLLLLNVSHWSSGTCPDKGTLCQNSSAWWESGSDELHRYKIHSETYKEYLQNGFIAWEKSKGPGSHYAQKTFWIIQVQTNFIWVCHWSLECSQGQQILLICF